MRQGLARMSRSGLRNRQLKSSNVLGLTRWANSRCCRRRSCRTNILACFLLYAAPWSLTEKKNWGKVRSKAAFLSKIDTKKPAWVHSSLVFVFYFWNENNWHNFWIALGFHTQTRLPDSLCGLCSPELPVKVGAPPWDKVLDALCGSWSCFPPHLTSEACFQDAGFCHRAHVLGEVPRLCLILFSNNNSA